MVCDADRFTLSDKKDFFQINYRGDSNNCRREWPERLIKDRKLILVTSARNLHFPHKAKLDPWQLFKKLTKGGQQSFKSRILEKCTLRK